MIKSLIAVTAAGDRIVLHIDSPGAIQAKLGAFNAAAMAFVATEQHLQPKVEDPEPGGGTVHPRHSVHRPGSDW